MIVSRAKDTNKKTFLRIYKFSIPCLLFLPAMRDFCGVANNKMAELKFEAPLAQFEETDEWGPVDYQSSITQQQAYLNNLKENLLVMDNNNLNNNTIEHLKINATGNVGDAMGAATNNNNVNNLNNNNLNKILTKDNIDNFNEAFTGSLEDLVNTFDEKITKCFGNYEQSVEELAPVQVRSQEEIMNECQ